MHKSSTRRDEREGDAQFPRRRTIKRHLTAQEKKRVAAANMWRCYMCGVVLPSTFEIDHVVPLFEGGPDTAENCRPACPSCHRIKSEEESIRRAKSRMSTMLNPHRDLVCRVCGMVVSRYFMHRCPIVHSHESETVARVKQSPEL